MDIVVKMLKIHMNYYLSMKELDPGIRLSGLPECISENLVLSVMKEKYPNDNYTKADVGDLCCSHGKVEVKCFTSEGPISFGPNTTWVKLIFLDATQWMKYKFTIHVLNVSHDDKLFENIMINKSESFDNHRKQRRRPRITWNSLKPQIIDKIETIFDSIIDVNLTNMVMEPKIDIQNTSVEPKIDIPHTIKPIMDILTDFNKLTVKELRTECKKRSIPGYSRKTKQELVELLRPKDIINLPITSNDKIIQHLTFKISKTNLDETKLTHIDLFAGIGAFTNALRNVATTIMANDICPDSEQIFKLNYPEVNFIKADIKTISVPYADIITAGFPCQSFSIAGKRDLNDPRGTLIDTTVKIILTNKPKFFILENVRGFMSINNGQIFDQNIKLLSEFYHINHDILNTCDITNIPQNRERIFIVGSLLELNININLKFPLVPNMTMAEILEPEPVESKYYYDSRFKDFDKIKANVNEQGYFYQYRRTIVRKLMGGKCPCLTANMGTGGHNVPLIFVDNKIRKLTSLELSRLQGIPDSFNWGDTSYSDRARLIGNSITFKVAELIASRIMESIV